MISQSKIDANRRNAAKSTGPRTASGKAVASMNAVKHGLCARKPLIPGESETDFAQFTSDWVGSLRPLGAHERLLAEQIIMAAWQLRRVPQLEAGLLARYMRQDGEHPFAMAPEAYQQLSRIDRHHTALQRTLDRSLKDLERMQAERGDQEPEEGVQNEPTEPELSVPEMLNQPAMNPGGRSFGCDSIPPNAG